ncbi:MAG TPA: oxygen-independent coproporphyrinogen III oxidase [Rhodanobacteraceae bacterium]|nr:oxygen-independent coproporphyrinogen III oxidase [Rhodanobacteraceae bacterium]
MTTATDIPEFDPALIARYDVPGPRYTSYPAATHFHSGFGEADLREAIERSNDGAGAKPLSLYVHVPFCTSPCFYCGCNRIITRDIGRADDYLEYLYREIALVAGLFDPGRPVRQLHFGGGTPNFLDIPRMAALMERLAAHFHFDVPDKREFGIEIDPRFADGDYIRGLGALGFNRISVGIQDFDPEVQQAVNRIQSVAQTREVLEAAREAGFESSSVDLIYGLPRQTMVGFARTLEEVIALAPNRVAVYGYAHLPNLFKAQRQIDASDLPDAATRLQLFGSALRRLTDAGYVYVGMDHFAREDDELVAAQRSGTLQRNFQGYSTHGECDIVGLGVSAISRIGDSYSQSARDLPGYYLALDAGRLPVVRGIWLDRDDLLRRAVIGELMCHGGIDRAGFGARHHLRFDDYFADDLERLHPLADDSLVELSTERIQVTARGRLLLRNIAMCFDVHLAREAPAVHYSRAI